MADVDPAGQPGEDLIATAFSSYRAAAGANFPAPAAAELMAKADTARPRKRALTVSLAALAFTGVIAGGVAVAHTVVSDGSGTVDRGHGDKTTTSDSTGESKTSKPADDNSPSGGSDDDGGGLHGVAITLPAWPGQEGQCPGGTFTFGDGGSSEPASGWTLPSQGVVTALDGDGAADDVIVEVDCAEFSGVVALERGGETISSKGFVETAMAPGVSVEVVSVDGNKVTVDNGAVTTRDSQETYVYDGGVFSPMPGGGPSDDPTDPTQTPSDDPSSSSPGPGQTS